MNLYGPYKVDCYKLGHEPMYSDGTEAVLNNFTPRTDKIYRRNCTRFYDGKLVFIGAQGAAMEIVESWDKFFDLNREIAVSRFQSMCDFVLGEGVINSESMGRLHDLGYLPLEIRTLDEGSKVPMGIPVMTVRNTIPEFYWLVNYLETEFSNLVWKPSTTATIAAEYKAMLTDFAVRTGTPLDLVQWQAHCFADRGMSGPEDAARSGLGHAASFFGSDSIGVIPYAQQYYGAGQFVIGSVPATEHAVATSNILRIEQAINAGNYWLKNDEQVEIAKKMHSAGEDKRLIAEMMFLYELMLKFPKGILSYVTDSFDFWGVLTKGLPYLKEVIQARDGKLVIRPDSGDPVEVVCGVKIHDMSSHSTLEILEEGESAQDSLADIAYDIQEDEEFTFYVRSMEGDIIEIEGQGEFNRYYDQWSFTGYSAEIADLTPEQKGAAQVLYELFGGTITDKGYKMYADCIGLIYGDSITTQRCLDILEGLEEKGYASGCCVFGVGSYTYQCVTRDTFGFAIKATHTIVNGEEIDIFKDPKTDSKKKSARGRVSVLLVDGEYKLYDQVSQTAFEEDDNCLVVRFKDGQFFNQTTLDVIRAKL